jgi:photosystem II stability/assembly factor-like uncharacterized protein
MQNKISLAILPLMMAILAFIDPTAAQTKTNGWQKIPVPTLASFRGLSAVSPDVVWAGGTNGTIIRTTDGGATWSVHAVAGAETLDFRGIHAFDANTAVIISSGKAEDGEARIYRTTDGGEHWKPLFEEKSKGIFFDAIAFWDSDHGIVVSDPVAGHFVVFTTADAGITWHHVWPDPESTPSALLNEGAFAASNSCIALNGSSNVWLATGGASISRVFRSNDRGNTWKVSEVPFHPTDAVSGLFSVAFRDARNGIAVGGVWAHPTSSPPENVFVTSDGGVTWRPGPQTIPPGQFLSSVIYKPAAGSAKSDRGNAPAAASAEVVAAGPGGIISMHPGGRWIHESDENINAVAYPTHSVGWAVGPKGTVLRSK